MRETPSRRLELRPTVAGGVFNGDMAGEGVDDGT
jgi:hypothetical protein